MKKPQFIQNQIYHIYNRGVEKRNIFLNKMDHLRFIHDMFVLNDENPVTPSNIRLAKRSPAQDATEQCLEVRPLNIKQKREPLVDILAFCLMPNHFHLLLSQKTDNGIVKFMQKIGTGYSMYFNKKYRRDGRLFQGSFKAVTIERDAHFNYILYYLHLNPLDLAAPEWRDGKLNDYEKAIEFLENYRWSSFPDYIGNKNFPSITQRELFLDFFGSQEQYKKDMFKWLYGMNISTINNIALE